MLGSTATHSSTNKFGLILSNFNISNLVYILWDPSPVHEVKDHKGR